MDTTHYYCIIMAGGAGVRLWPVSTAPMPKQFLEVQGTGKSFIRNTFERFARIIPVTNILVITQERYAGLVKEQIPEMDPGNILTEPYSRSTGPCIVYGTYAVLKRDPLATVTVTPSDHIIINEAAFRSSILSAMDFASNNDVLMTLGINPDRPDTNYGYIQITGGKTAKMGGEPVKVKTFTEKPDLLMAQVFFRSGEFLWNSGIFTWKASVIREEMERYMPITTALFNGWENELGGPSEHDFIVKAYGGVEKISIDYAVMEKTSRAWVYPSDFGWADIGAWDSMYNFCPKDEDGNVVLSRHKFLQDDRNTLAVTTNPDKLIAVKGLENYVIVDTDDVLMICPRDEKQIKSLISGLGMPENQKYK